jgi:leucine-rich PPR motif-containing protein
MLHCTHQIVLVCIACRFTLPTLHNERVYASLDRNDLAGAMEQFELCCQKYRATPWKNELARKMIQVEDAVSLQKLTDLSTQIHGEVNSLYDLVFAFVECGRIRQARKILEVHCS